MTIDEKIHIILDMDNVLADFSVNQDEEEQLKNMYEEGFFLSLKPLHNKMNKVVWELQKRGYEIHILSAAPKGSRYGRKEKIEWINRFLPTINPLNVNICWTGDNKAKIAEKNGIDIKKSILVDDYKLNCKNWKKAGGEYIKVDFHKSTKIKRDCMQIQHNFSELLELL